MFQAVPPPIIRSTYSFRYCQPILLLAATTIAAKVSVDII